MADEPNPRQDLAAFGGALEKLRRTRGWSQQRLATALGIGTDRVGQLERGCIPPTVMQLAYLNALLGPEVLDAARRAGLTRES